MNKKKIITIKQEEIIVLDKEKADKLGKWMFRILAVLALVFSWWLVIYDHGVPSAHG